MFFIFEALFGISPISILVDFLRSLFSDGPAERRLLLPEKSTESPKEFPQSDGQELANDDTIFNYTPTVPSVTLPGPYRANLIKGRIDSLEYASHDRRWRWLMRAHHSPDKNPKRIREVARMLPFDYVFTKFRHASSRQERKVIGFVFRMRSFVGDRGAGFNDISDAWKLADRIMKEPLGIFVYELFGEIGGFASQRALAHLIHVRNNIVIRSFAIQAMVRHFGPEVTTGWLCWIFTWTQNEKVKSEIVRFLDKLPGGTAQLSKTIKSLEYFR
jgi:hypothetical protein